MGSWGSGLFQNDSAADLVFVLEHPADLELIINALRAVDDHKGYLDVDFGDAALAAAEIVTALCGQPA